MFAQSVNSYVDDDWYNREDKTERNMVHIVCNYCGERGQYSGSRYYLVQVHLWKDAKAYR